MTDVKRNKKLGYKKPINWCRVSFILFATVLPWIFWLVFYVYVNISGFLMAFQDADKNWTLDHFVRLFNELKQGGDAELVLAFKNTIITWLIGFFCYPFRVLVPYLIYKKIPFAGIYRIIFFLPGIIFGMAVTMVFTQMVGVNGPIAQQIGQWLNLDYVPELLADTRFANYTVWAHMLWLSFPGDLIIWGGTFARIPTDVLESGQLDGVSWIQEFTLITVPLVWPTVSLQMLLSICGILAASGSVFLLTNGQFGTQTLSVWLYQQNLAGVGNPNSLVFNYMSAVGIVMTAISVSLTFFIRKYVERAFNDVDF